MDGAAPTDSGHQELRFKIAPTPAREIALYLTASDVGDGNAGDFVGGNSRGFIPGSAAADVARRAGSLSCVDRATDRTLTRTAKYLAAAAEVESGPTNLARSRRNMGSRRTRWRRGWITSAGASGPVKLEGHFTERIKARTATTSSAAGAKVTLNLAANSSDHHVRIPGNMNRTAWPASGAESRRGDRLAQSGGGARARDRGDSSACTSGVRQWRDVVAGIATRLETPTDREWDRAGRESGRASTDRKSVSAAWRRIVAAHRSARRESLVRPDSG